MAVDATCTGARSRIYGKGSAPKGSRRMGRRTYDLRVVRVLGTAQGSTSPKPGCWSGSFRRNMYIQLLIAFEPIALCRAREG